MDIFGGNNAQLRRSILWICITLPMLLRCQEAEAVTGHAYGQVAEAGAVTGHAYDQVVEAEAVTGHAYEDSVIRYKHDIKCPERVLQTSKFDRCCLAKPVACFVKGYRDEHPPECNCTMLDFNFMEIYCKWGASETLFTDFQVYEQNLTVYTSCDIDPTPCNTSQQIKKGAPMKCLPNGLYPPITDTVYFPCKTAGYMFVATCPFPECHSRFKIPFGYFSCYPPLEQLPTWLGFQPVRNVCSLNATFEEKRDRKCDLLPQCINYGRGNIYTMTSFITPPVASLDDLIKTERAKAKQITNGNDIKLMFQERIEAIMEESEFRNFDCEHLCDYRTNVANIGCLPVPTCNDGRDIVEIDPDNALDVYGECLPWCADSKNVENCNPRPFCKRNQNGSWLTPTRFTEENLFGSYFCEIRACEPDERPIIDHCIPPQNLTTAFQMEHRRFRKRKHTDEHPLFFLFPYLHAVGTLLILLGIVVLRWERDPWNLDGVWLDGRMEPDISRTITIDTTTFGPTDTPERSPPKTTGSGVTLTGTMTGTMTGTTTTTGSAQGQVNNTEPQVLVA